jgi:hypothetical protein
MSVHIRPAATEGFFSRRIEFYSLAWRMTVLARRGSHVSANIIRRHSIVSDRLKHPAGSSWVVFA